MKAEDVIRDIQYKYSEHIEMEKCPATFVAGVLANKIISLQNHVEYLERRLEYANTP